MCLLACGAGSAVAQHESDLLAKQRSSLLWARTACGEEGRGWAAIHSGFAIAGIAGVRRPGKQVLSIKRGKRCAKRNRQGHSLITFGEDCDGAADGKIYVADRGANLIPGFFSGKARLFVRFPVKNPLAVAALPEGEVAVATLREPHLVVVFDKNGRDVREFGDPEPLAERRS